MEVRRGHGTVVATRILQLFEVAAANHLRKSEGPSPSPEP